MSQSYDGRNHIIAYMSAKLNDTQKSYHPVEKECLAVILSLERFRHYVDGNHFSVVTDHNSLVWLKNCKDPTGRIARWALRLQAYNFNIIHKKFGENHPVCVLSREINLETAPVADFEICYFDTLSISNALLSEQKVFFEMCLIDCQKPPDTGDNWYKTKYSEVEAGKNASNYKIETIYCITVSIISKNRSKMNGKFVFQLKSVKKS